MDYTLVLTIFKTTGSNNIARQLIGSVEDLSFPFKSIIVNQIFELAGICASISILLQHNTMLM